VASRPHYLLRPRVQCMLDSQKSFRPTANNAIKYSVFHMQSCRDQNTWPRSNKAAFDRHRGNCQNASTGTPCCIVNRDVSDSLVNKPSDSPLIFPFADFQWHPKNSAPSSTPPPPHSPRTRGDLAGRARTVCRYW
jgi:hypothetical protein